MLPLTIDPMPIPNQVINLVSNLPPITTTVTGGDVTFDQWVRSSFRTGSVSYGYIFTSVTLRFREFTQDANLFVRLHKDNAGGLGDLITNFTNPVSITTTAANNNFTLTTPQILAPGTDYWLVAGISSSGSGLYRWALADSVNQTGETGWSIGDSVFFSGSQGSSWTPFGGFSASQFSINGQNI